MHLIDPAAAAKLLREKDNIAILAHMKPDGDTLGSSFGLYYALRRLGKRVRVDSPDGYPDRYWFIFGEYGPEEFEPEYVVTADVASLQLLGGLRETYENRIDLCIDHHKSNEIPAEHTVLDVGAAATTQIVYKVIRALGVEIDHAIANSIYTGLSTDTGCFKYYNVTRETHLIAAEMIEAGADHGLINKLMFDTKTKGRVEVERLLLDRLEYFYDDQCALITIPDGLTQEYGVLEEELDGISAIPRRILGVKAGITIRERPDGSQRVSLRTGDGVDAARVCAALGGGGHKNAAGCTLTGSSEEAKKQVLQLVEKELKELQT